MATFAPTEATSHAAAPEKEAEAVNPSPIPTLLLEEVTVWPLYVRYYV